MFAKLRNSRWMLIEGNDKELAIGFASRVTDLVRVHQFGEKSTVVRGGPEYQYPARNLLGLTNVEREMIRDRLFRQITE